MEPESQELNRTVQDAEQAIERNKAAISKLDAQLAKRSGQRENFERQAASVKQAVEGVGLAPETSAEMERQLETLRRRIDAMWEQNRPKVAPKTAPSGDIVASLRQNMQELEDNLARAKRALADHRKTLEEKGLNFPIKKVNALIEGGHIPAERLEWAKARLAELEAAARTKSRQGPKSAGRRRIRLTV